MDSIWQASNVITTWIKSCKSEPQIQTCINAINEFICNRIYDVTQIQVDIIKSDLQELIHVQRLLIASGTTKEKQQRFPCTDEQPMQQIIQ